MTKKQFLLSCGIPGQSNGYKITEALKQLLEKQKDNTIRIPSEKYTDAEDENTKTQDLIDYLEGCESVTVYPKDGNGRESYISEIRMNSDKCIIVTVYDYYACEFRDVLPGSFENAKDLVDFAVEYAEFTGNNKKALSADELTCDQMSVLDDFVKAAKRLKNAGVALLWDDDDNSLAVVNTNAMRDGEFLSFDDLGVAADENTESVYAQLNKLNDVEVTYISSTIDYLFYPKHSHEKI